MPDKKVGELYDMIHRGEGDTSSVRPAFIIGPDNLIKLMLTYPKSVGRSFDEVLRVLDAPQLNESGPFATPAHGAPATARSTTSTSRPMRPKELFPGLDVVKPYLRYTGSTSI